MLGLGRGWPAEVQISIFNVLVSVKLESQFFFSLQKANLLVRKVHYLHTKFSFSMPIFLRDSQIFSVTCGCVQKLNIYKIYLENLRFSSLVIEFFYPCSRVAANFFSLWKKASIIWCKTHLLLTRLASNLMCCAAKRRGSKRLEISAGIITLVVETVWKKRKKERKAKKCAGIYALSKSPRVGKRWDTKLYLQSKFSSKSYFLVHFCRP